MCQSTLFMLKIRVNTVRCNKYVFDEESNKSQQNPTYHFTPSPGRLRHKERLFPPIVLKNVKTEDRHGKKPILKNPEACLILNSVKPRDIDILIIKTINSTLNPLPITKDAKSNIQITRSSVILNLANDVPINILLVCIGIASMRQFQCIPTINDLGKTKGLNYW